MIPRPDLDAWRREAYSLAHGSDYTPARERWLSLQILTLIDEVERLQEALERERWYEPMKDCGLKEAR